MRLLVSVSSADEAMAALAGGADIIDAKNPLAGSLGPVTADVLVEIIAAVSGVRLVTAALGDMAHEAEAERAAAAFCSAGAALVKLGFAGVADPRRVEALTAAAVRGAQTGRPGGSGVVAVAYADADCVGSLPAARFVEVAAHAGASGVLLDTADKSGPGLRGLVSDAALEAWVAEAHEAGLLVALAGQLAADDLEFVRGAGADIAGVRGAACDAGRSGRISAVRVARLRALCGAIEAGNGVGNTGGGATFVILP
jgi:(5-formylfuran-3-yl)methyl phosphate synthase